MDSKSIFTELWDSYKRIILHNIVTSFGLDFIVKDQIGGDVDTIHSVRDTERYKNVLNEKEYENREAYNSTAYHHNEVYDSMIREVRNSHDFFDDAYVPGNRIFYGKASGIGTDHRANLDHVISAFEIHNDRGRILAGLDGIDLANQESNLQFTNEHLNKSMKDMSIDDYIKWRTDKEDPLPDDVETQMKYKDSKARYEYNKAINKAYYSSSKFYKDVSKAALERGLEMGARQTLGFFFLEIWFACEEKLKELPSGSSIKDCVNSIVLGIKCGAENAIKKYKELFNQFEKGFKAGALASLTTTLINCFVTTDKETIRYIRQINTIIVQAGTILIINPEDLKLGDQLKSASISIVSGASVLVGTTVGNQIAKTQIGQDKKIGYTVVNFCSSLITGLISCTLLIMIDRSDFMNRLVTKMNTYATVDCQIKKTEIVFSKLAAELAECDLSEFSESIEAFSEIVQRLQNIDEYELNDTLINIFEEYDVTLPWKGDFDSFMSNSGNKLFFE